MLVAYGPDNRPVVAEETPLEQLQEWSHERVLHCPNCRGVVFVRGGPGKRAQLHFAHQKGECAWSTEAESVRHMRGKVVLAQWLREQFRQAVISLEERLPEPNRIADIFVVHADGRRWAVEFQCAPLEVGEWQRRHDAYRNANIIDIWIIGDNRREKQEGFIEAIIAAAHEVMFLDPLVTPARFWLRWPVTHDTVREWQRDGNMARTPLLEGWVGHLGVGALILGRLHEVRLGENGKLLHPALMNLEMRTELLRVMSISPRVDEKVVVEYLRYNVDEETIHVVLLPLVRAYLRDPELLQRYNFGRGRSGQLPSEADRQRVKQARAWFAKLAQQGFPAAKVQELAKEVPFVGPYAAFVGYVEMLTAVIGG
jgi:Competence protein CoiA-like family